MDKKISVIVPVYNVEPYLDKCVRSITEQTYDNLEIILVDDGSPDNCPALCDEWAEKDDRITVIHKENGGLSSARNVGIKKATGEHILFVDSDDYLENDACEVLVKYADDVDLIVSEATIYKNGKVMPRIHTVLKEDYIYTGTEIAAEEIKADEWFAAACYNMYKRTFLLENNLFFHEGILHEDIDYLPRLFLAAKTVKYKRFRFYNYVNRSDSICGRKTDKHFSDLMDIYKRWKILNETIDDPEVKDIYNKELSKFVISTCRQFRKKENVLPEGIDKKFLIQNTLNFKETVKTIGFILFRNLYVRL